MVWEKLSFELFRGFENGCVVSTDQPDEILILGGKTSKDGDEKVLKYNMKEGTVINRNSLQLGSTLS